MKPEQVIGRSIRTIRESRGMTQEDLGLRLGKLLVRPWSRQAVSGAERGERAFTGAELLAVAHVLQTWVGALLMPPIEAEQVDMPSGAALTRADVERTAFDPETRNVLPIANEAIRKVAVWLNELLAGGQLELHELRDAYEVLTIGGKLPDHGLRARAAANDKFAREAHGLPEPDKQKGDDHE